MFESRLSGGDSVTHDCLSRPIMSGTMVVLKRFGHAFLCAICLEEYFLPSPNKFNHPEHQPSEIRLEKLVRCQVCNRVLLAGDQREEANIKRVTNRTITCFCGHDTELEQQLVA